MTKMKNVAERKAKFNKMYPICRKRAIELVDAMVKEGLEYSDADRILRMAQSELIYRRSGELMERAEEDAHIKCKSCGKEISEKANFCKYCGIKVKEACNFCWVRRKDNYICGESNCQGFGLFLLEKSKTK